MNFARKNAKRKSIEYKRVRATCIHSIKMDLILHRKPRENLANLFDAMKSNVSLRRYLRERKSMCFLVIKIKLSVSCHETDHLHAKGSISIEKKNDC